MKIRFYGHFVDQELKRLLEEVAKERGHTITRPTGRLPAEVALVTFVDGRKYYRTREHMRAAHERSGFVIVINPVPFTGGAFLDRGAFDYFLIPLEDEERRRAEIGQLMERTEKVLAEIT